MITLRIGTGGDYTTFMAARNAIDGAPLADDYTLDLISDVTETLTATGNLAYNGKTITLTCSFNEANIENPIGWYKVTLAADIWINFTGNSFNVGSNVVQYLWIQRTALNTFAPRDMIAMGGNNDAFVTTLHHLFFKGNGSTTRGDVAWGSGTSNLTLTAYDIKMWDMLVGIDLDITTVSAVRRTRYFENITMYNCVNGYYTTDNVWNLFNLKNIVIAGSSGTDWPTQHAQLTITNCADSDGSLTTGVNTQSNIVPADEFVSLDDTVNDFLKLGGGTFDVGGKAVPQRGKAPLKVQFTDQSVYDFPVGVLAVNGTAPTIEGHDTDIEDLAVPSTEGFYSIGCHQAQIEESQ